MHRRTYSAAASRRTTTTMWSHWIILSCCLCLSGAFSQEWTNRQARSLGRKVTRFTTSSPAAAVALFMSNDDDDGSLAESTGNPAIELTSMLAKLDKQWKIQQASKPSSRWSKIVFDDEDGDTSSSKEEPFEATAASAMPSPGAPSSLKDFVYLLEPPSNTVPSCMLVFLGGAGLGQFPQIAYKEFLERLSDRLNAAVVTAPYTVGLDHFALAKKTGELSRRAVEHCQEDTTRLYPANLPVYCVAHSLGGKLATIHMAATQQEYSGVGLISFNNFGFTDTIRMAREFAEQIRMNSSTDRQSKDFAQGGTSGGDMLNQVFTFAETVLGTIGLDFSPNPEAMNKLIGLKYDEERQANTRLFVFDDDTLDNTQEFKGACQGFGPAISELPGTHLTPVYFKFGLDELPEEARGVAKGVTGGIESASFGNEEELSALVDEVCDWILGKGPSRRSTQPMIAGSVAESE